MTKLDLWFWRADMLVIASCFTATLVYLMLRVKNRYRKADWILVLAILYAVLNISVSFFQDCANTHLCYDMTLLAVLCSGLFHWIMCWMYLKASIEVPFFFQVGLYLKDKETMVTIRKQHNKINVLFWVNIAFLLISTIVLITIEHIG
jgi:hypothetical protein